MLVVHVTLCAQVIVEAHLALPTHSHDAVLLAAVTDDIGVTYAWRGRRGSRTKSEWDRSFNMPEIPISMPLYLLSVAKKHSCKATAILGFLPYASN